ncbi:hypothetical protein ACLBWZ_08970 [Brucellaceae bacterium C25G]
MSDVVEVFNRLINTTLIPQYCEHPTMGMTPHGFKNDIAKLSTIDIALFLQAWDSGIIQYAGKGSYHLGQSSAVEKFFWEGPKVSEIRSFSLWAEPIITAGVLARLHLELRWPINLIGSQSKGNWAYDAVAFKQTTASNYCILCEVKKTSREVDRLSEYMNEYLAIPPMDESNIRGARLNAYRKVKALRENPSEFLWIAGPGRYDLIYRVTLNGHQISLNPVPLAAMIYQSE